MLLRYQFPPGVDTSNTDPDVDRNRAPCLQSRAIAGKQTAGSADDATGPKVTDETPPWASTAARQQVTQRHREWKRVTCEQTSLRWMRGKLSPGFFCLVNTLGPWRMEDFPRQRNASAETVLSKALSLSSFFCELNRKQDFVSFLFVISLILIWFFLDHHLVTNHRHRKLHCILKYNLQHRNSCRNASHVHVYIYFHHVYNVNFLILLFLSYYCRVILFSFCVVLSFFLKAIRLRKNEQSKNFTVWCNCAYDNNKLLTLWNNSSRGWILLNVLCVLRLTVFILVTLWTLRITISSVFLMVSLRWSVKTDEQCLFTHAHLLLSSGAKNILDLNDGSVNKRWI